MKRQRPAIGDVFTIQVGEDRIAVGQVLEPIPEALNSLGIAVWAPRGSDDLALPATSDTPIAVVLTTPDLLKRGTWAIRERVAPFIHQSARPYERFRSQKWVGAKIIGSGILREFLEAYVGLVPWDCMADRAYFDTLLYPGQTRPATAVFAHVS